MPRRRNDTPQTPPQQPYIQPYALPERAEWGGFINIRLSDEQKDSFRAWMDAHGAEVPALYVDMLGNGVKITHSFDHVHNCFIISVTGALVGADRSRRYVSTSRSPVLNECIGLTVWKHNVLAKGDYGSYRPHDDSFMSWG